MSTRRSKHSRSASKADSADQEDAGHPSTSPDSLSSRGSSDELIAAAGAWSSAKERSAGAEINSCLEVLTEKRTQVRNVNMQRLHAILSSTYLNRGVMSIVQHSILGVLYDVLTTTKGATQIIETIGCACLTFADCEDVSRFTPLIRRRKSEPESILLYGLLYLLDLDPLSASLESISAYFSSIFQEESVSNSTEAGPREDLVGSALQEAALQCLGIFVACMSMDTIGRRSAPLRRLVEDDFAMHVLLRSPHTRCKVAAARLLSLIYERDREERAEHRDDEEEDGGGITRCGRVSLDHEDSGDADGRVRNMADEQADRNDFGAEDEGAEEEEEDEQEEEEEEDDEQKEEEGVDDDDDDDEISAESWGAAGRNGNIELKSIARSRETPLLRLLRRLSSGTVRAGTKKASAADRKIFRQVYEEILTGHVRAESVLVNGVRISLRSKADQARWSLLTKFVGAGMNNHVVNNPVVQGLLHLTETQVASFTVRQSRHKSGKASRNRDLRSSFG